MPGTVSDTGDILVSKTKFFDSMELQKLPQTGNKNETSKMKVGTISSFGANVRGKNVPELDETVLVFYILMAWEDLKYQGTISAGP